MVYGQYVDVVWPFLVPSMIVVADLRSLFGCALPTACMCHLHTRTCQHAACHPGIAVDSPRCGMLLWIAAGVVARPSILHMQLGMSRWSGHR